MMIITPVGLMMFNECFGENTVEYKVKDIEMIIQSNRRDGK